ncbi:MAG TPA: EAL domain-containing protein [Malonomonas sp.]
MFRDEKLRNYGYSATQNTPRILIVDDDPHLCRSTQAILSCEGFRTQTANGGAEAIEELNRNIYPLMLLDLDMPRIDGFAVMEHILTNNINTAVIVFSGESDINKALQVVKAGARDFVRKPSTPAEIILSIQNLLEKIHLEQINRQIVEELKKSEELHRFVVNNSPDLMFLLDKNGSLAFANNTHQLLGYSEQEVVGKHFSEFVDPSDLTRASHYFYGNRRLSNGRIEIKLQDKNKKRQRYVEITATRVARNFPGGALMNDHAQTNSRRFIGFYGVARDITEQKRSEEIIRYQHNHDILTGLPNRGLLNDRLSMLIGHAMRRKEKCAVLTIDIDRFKLVNDSYGQMIGDELLQSFTDRMKRCVRDEDTLARLGGDEFVLLLPGITSADSAFLVAEKIIQEMIPPFNLNEHEIHITLSIGIALYPEHGVTKEELLKNSDTAVGSSKSTSKSNYCLYSQDLFNHSCDKVSIENLLRGALKNDQLVIHYQPQIDLPSGRIHAAEALVRLKTPEGELILPGDFISIAEESNLINELGDYVLGKACQDIRQWQAMGINLPVAINISANQLILSDFSDSILERIEAYGLTPEVFELELTENVIIQNLEKTMNNLRRLTDAGVKIAIDDFGKGYSSLSYLDMLPLTTLKLDKSFIRNIRTNQSENTIIPAISNVSQGLKLKFIVEGVETRAQHHYLKKQGSCIAQGYHYSRPVDCSSFVTFVQNYHFSNFD